MFAVNGHAQDMWIGDDVPGGSIVSSVSEPSRSEFDNFTAGNVGGKKVTPSGASSLSNGKVPTKIPGVMRTSDLLMRNVQYTLPNEKAFSIQIGWRLFRLSGASINSDGKFVFSERARSVSLKSLERPRISQPISRTNYDQMTIATGRRKLSSSTEIRIHSPIYAGIYKVKQ